MWKDKKSGNGKKGVQKLSEIWNFVESTWVVIVSNSLEAINYPAKVNQTDIKMWIRNKSQCVFKAIAVLRMKLTGIWLISGKPNVPTGYNPYALDNLLSCRWFVFNANIV